MSHQKDFNVVKIVKVKKSAYKFDLPLLLHNVFHINHIKTYALVSMNTYVGKWLF